jgi:hypothetical protein
MKKKARPVRRVQTKKEEVQSPVIRVAVVFLLIMAIALVAYAVKVYMP